MTRSDLVRIICTGCGFALTKAALPCRCGAGYQPNLARMLANITYPSLIFSKIVPAFSVQNISALVLVAVLYQILGILIAWIVSQFFWVPHRFRWGILVAGGWGNVGDISTAVVLSIMSPTPFNGSADQTLSVGYIAGFIFVSVITFYVEHDDVKDALRERRRRILRGPQGAIRRLTGRKSVPEDILNAKAATSGKELEKNATTRPAVPSKHVSFYDPENFPCEPTSGGPSQ
ncbi:hypothetical protein C8R44DRAFT_864635 [Mycena epipterygia]|nr:hypothetical protein C8R44DRAFT_864635 [Mycena epipterygia]